MKTSVGQVLINSILPEGLRDYARQIDGKTLRHLMQQIAEKYPLQYRDILFKLKRLGDTIAYREAPSLALEDLRSLPNKDKLFAEVRKKAKEIEGRNIPEELKKEELMKLYGEFSQLITNKTKEFGLQENNAIALAINSGARGNWAHLASLIGAPVMAEDWKGDPLLAIPIERSYAEGLTPEEYWAASYGVRTSLMQGKLGVGEAGAFGKHLSLGAAPLVVTTKDCGTENGLLVDINNPDNMDRALSQDTAGFKRGTILTPSVIEELKNQNIQKILLHSPLTCEAEKGICALSVGVWEGGKLPEVGSNIGLQSASALSEPLTQLGLSAKHRGGLLKTKTPVRGGFELITDLLEIPKNFQLSASLAEKDGEITSIEEAPQGGQIIKIADQSYYIEPDLTIKVKIGDKVFAGDQLSDGVPNPSDVVRLKGLGAGRLYLTDQLQDTYKKAGIGIDRRNFEIISRALLNTVEVRDGAEIEGVLPGEIIDAQAINKMYKPKKVQELNLKNAGNTYLARPIFHYPIGTLLSKRIIDNLTNAGVQTAFVSEQEPPILPVMMRLSDIPRITGDWMTSFHSSRLRDSLLGKLHKGERRAPTTYVPFVAKGLARPS